MQTLLLSHGDREVVPERTNRVFELTYFKCFCLLSSFPLSCGAWQKQKSVFKHLLLGQK